MVKINNLKKLTANSLIGVLLLGGLLIESSNNKAVQATNDANGCSNNGHGNNAPMSISLSSGKLTIGHYDPTNPGSQRDKLIADLDGGKFGTSGSNKISNSAQYYIDFTGTSYNLTTAEATNIVNSLPDWEESGNGSTILDCGSDYDNDGIDDFIELGSNYNNPTDTDNDGIPNYNDTDSDGDGTPDSTEGTGDSDNDGTPNYLDNTNNSNSDSDDACYISDQDATSLTLTGTIRDFKAYRNTSGNINPGGHPDFERKPNTDKNPNNASFNYGSDNNITTDNIGSDKKPVYKGHTYSTTNANNFNQWYNDASGVNQSTSYDITLADPDGDGVYVYSNNNFFPIDNQLFGNEGRSHNYHFTYELHTKFTYQSGQTFTFSGDDDVWVYINGKKVIDLGGVHSSQTKTVNLASVASSIGLQAGRTYDLDFFFAERHTTQSNFTISSSIAFTQKDSDCDGVIDTTESNVDYDGDGVADPDIDRDGIPNYLDTDNNNNDVDDDDENAGDADGDGDVDAPSGVNPSDVDGDGIKNSIDPDDDGDGISDASENTGDADEVANDPNAEYIAAYLDPSYDSDHDGTPNSSETNPPSVSDIDGDGVPNSYDTDSDGDGWSDIIIEDSSNLIYDGGDDPDIIIEEDSSDLTYDPNPYIYNAD
jgi:fibro-slime domain-containing protein